MIKPQREMDVELYLHKRRPCYPPWLDGWLQIWYGLWEVWQ
jgi:hypothetical protein